MTKNTYLVQMNNYEGDRKQPFETEVQSDKDLAAMWGNIQTRTSTPDQTMAFWDEIDLVCPKYDSSDDEIDYITKL